MRRLTNHAQRERGAMAVVIALCMVMLLSFAAIAVDVGGVWSEKKQLQNGADAGALAIAESCARGACANTADKYAKANKGDTQATGVVVGAMTSPVTVESSYTRQNWFGSVVGVPTMSLWARATAEWGYVSAGAAFPVAFSVCEFFAQTGGWNDNGTAVNSNEISVLLKTKNTCSPPAHAEVPGGFGWLDNVDCVATVSEGSWVGSRTGYADACKDFDWSTIKNQTLLVPIFDAYDGTGAKAKYKIMGMAAFTVTGYCFDNSQQWNVSNCPADKQIKGHFTSYADLSGGYSINPSAPHFGTQTVRLIG